MVRMLLYILLAIVAITLVKVFIGIILRGLGNYLDPGAAGTSTPGTANRQQPQGSKGGTLRKDSLTGIYVADEIAISKVINGRTHYFASEQNYREYVHRASASA